MFFYSDTKASGQSTINVWQMNGTAAYLRHYNNYLFLAFVVSNPRATRQDCQTALRAAPDRRPMLTS